MFLIEGFTIKLVEGYNSAGNWVDIFPLAPSVTNPQDVDPLNNLECEEVDARLGCRFDSLDTS